MQTKTINQLAVGLSFTAGALDFCTGLGFIGAPALMLHLMGVKKVYGDLVYLRFVGAFVLAVGTSYLWAWCGWRLTRKGTPPRDFRNNHNLPLSGGHVCGVGYFTWLVGAGLGECHAG